MNELKYKQKNKFTIKRKYFSLIPHYITDHSTANDLALYLQIKRRAGEKEDGICDASEKLFKDRLKVGSKAVKKSLEFLIKNQWITFVGKKIVITKGGPQKINTYIVNNIWPINEEFYNNKGVFKRIPPENERDISKEEKGSSFEQQRRTLKEERIVSLEEQEKIREHKKEIRKSLNMESG